MANCLQNGIESKINKRIQVDIDEVCCEKEYTIRIRSIPQNITVYIDGDILSGDIIYDKKEFVVTLQYNGICFDDQPLSWINLEIIKICNGEEIKEIKTVNLLILNDCLDEIPFEIKRIELSKENCDCFYKIYHTPDKNASGYLYTWSDDDFNSDINSEQISANFIYKPITPRNDSECPTEVKKARYISTPCEATYLLPCELVNETTKIKVNSIKSSGAMSLESKEILLPYQSVNCENLSKIDNIDITENDISIVEADAVLFKVLPDRDPFSLQSISLNDATFPITNNEINIKLTSDTVYNYRIKGECDSSEGCDDFIYCTDMGVFRTPVINIPEEEEEPIDYTCNIENLNIENLESKVILTWDVLSKDESYSLFYNKDGYWYERSLGNVNSVDICKDTYDIIKLEKTCYFGDGSKKKIVRRI